MARPELGLKRQCQNCGAKFYDLSRDPIVCPKCGTPFVAAAVVASAAAARSRPAPAAAAEPADVGEELIDAEAGDVELVSLEEAEEGTPGAKAPAADEELEVEEVVEDEADDAAPFLEEDEDGDDDVADLIDGDIEDDEEA